MTYTEMDVDYKLKLTMLIGAMNVARMATEDKDLSQLLTSILIAGNCLDEAVIQGVAEWVKEQNSSG
jgi:hypothetical protein